MMKLLKHVLVLFTCVNAFSTYSQISFVLTPSLCSGDSVIVTANTNSYPATTFSWSSNPSGAVFSSASSSTTKIYFPQSGSYSILLMGSVGNSSTYATQSITVHPSPQLIISASSGTICPGQSSTLIATGADTYTWVPSMGLVISIGGTAHVSPGATSVYSVSGSTTAGCISHKTYTLHFGVFPNLVLVATPSAVCAGNTSTLAALGANAYSISGSTFTGTSNQSTLNVPPGNYTVIASNGGTCIDSSVITIGTNPPLNLVIAANRTLVCKDGGDTLVPINLNASGALNYYWEPYDPLRMTYSVGPATSISPSISTCYTLTGSSPGCEAKTVLCIGVNYCVGLNEANSLNGILMYPNPVRDELTIRHDFQGRIKCEIINLFGQLILTKEFDCHTSQTNTIQLAELVSGCYLIRISQNNELLFTQKLIKD